MTKWMDKNRDNLPAPKKVRVKTVIKKIEKTGGAISFKVQADALREALGWLDNAHWNALALGAIRQIHENGFRLIRLRPPSPVQKKIEEWRLAAQKAQPVVGTPGVSYGDGGQA